MAKTKKVTKKTRNNVTSKEIGKRIKERRKKLQMTQAELGEKSFLAEKTISAIENGRRNASLESLENIAKALDVDRAYLLLEIDYPKYGPQKFANYVERRNNFLNSLDICSKLFRLGKYSVERWDFDRTINFFDDNADKGNNVNNENETASIIHNFLESYFGSADISSESQRELMKKMYDLFPGDQKTTVYAISNADEKGFLISEKTYLKMCQELIDYGEFLLEHYIANLTEPNIIPLPDV